MGRFYIFCICFAWMILACCAPSQALSAEASRATAALKPEISVQVGHSTTVSAVAVSPDGKTIATGGEDDVKLWETATGELKRSLRGMQSTVASLNFAPGGDTIAAAGWDGRICLWKSASGDLLHQWSETGANFVFFARDGEHLWTGSMSGQVKEWDVRAARATRTLINQKYGQGLLAYNPRLGLFASASGKTVNLWDAQSNAPVKSLLMTAPVTALAFSSQSSDLAVGLSDKTVQMWNAGVGTYQRSLPVEPQPIVGLAFSPDGKSLAIATALTVRLRDANTGRLLSKMLHNLRLTAMSFTPDGKNLVRGSDDKTAVLWDARTGQQRQVFGRAATMLSLALAPDGRTLAGASEDHAIFLWDVRTGELIRTLEQPGGVSAVAFSPDGKVLASGSLAASQVQLWDAASGAKLNVLDGYKGPVRALAFSPDGKVLASGGGDNALRLWDVQAVQEARLLRKLEGHEKPVMSLAFSPDGTAIATASADKSIKVWDVNTGQLTKTLTGHRSTVYSVAFAPQGDLLASNAFDKTVRLWDVRSGVLQRTIETKLPGTAVRFSPDGTQIVGNGRSAIYVWDRQSGNLKHTLHGHESYVFSFAFLPGANILASAGEDQIKLWDMKKGRLLASLVVLPSPRADSQQPAASSNTLPKALTADARMIEGLQQLSGRDYLAVTEQGYYKGSVQADRFVKFRLGNELYPAECFQAHYYRPDLVRHVLTGQEVLAVGDFKGARPPKTLLKEVSRTAGDSISGELAQLSVEAFDDSAVERVEFLVNGLRTQARPLTSDSRPLTSDSRLLDNAENSPNIYRVQRRFAVQLPLPAGAVKVQAIVFDEDGLQSPRAELTLSRLASPSPRGKLLGLCVGVSRHVDERLNLRFPGSDALAIAAALQKPGTLYNSIQIQTLIDEQASVAGVRAALERLVAQSSRADTIFVSLSGHGWRDEKGNFYFATHEVNRQRVQTTALSWDVVVQSLTQLAQKSRRVVVLLDACHSGSAATNEELVKAALRTNAGVLFFASSRGSELSLENAEWGHGAFAKAVLEALNGNAETSNPKSFNLLDFMAYVARRVKTLTQDQQHPSVPYLQDFDTDAALISRM